MAEKRPNRTMGPLDAVFWEYCGRGELRLQTCARCRRIFWPPVPICDTCGTWDLVWERMSGRGKVLSGCTFERAYYPELPVPWDCILVELEEGPLFLSNPSGFTHHEITKDMPVKVAFLDCEDAFGAFRLPVFERA
jgi:uncharacterized OB-fold protein